MAEIKRRLKRNIIKREMVSKNCRNCADKLRKQKYLNCWVSGLRRHLNVSDVKVEEGGSPQLSIRAVVSCGETMKESVCFAKQ